MFPRSTVNESLQALEGIGDHVAGEENVEPSEPNVLTPVHLHRFLYTYVEGERVRVRES